MADPYNSFDALAAKETNGVHFRICVAKRPSPIVIVAPHGGLIEIRTSEIAALIAADKFSLYCFEGLVPRRREASLHLASKRFDEPQAVRLVEASEIAIGVHGRKDRLDDQAVWVGGLEERLRDAIADALARSGFISKTTGEGHPLSGRHPANICNRGSRGAGVQLELPRALRNRLASDAMLESAFAAAVRETIEATYPRLPPA